MARSSGISRQTDEKTKELVKKLLTLKDMQQLMAYLYLPTSSEKAYLYVNNAIVELSDSATPEQIMEISTQAAATFTEDEQLLTQKTSIPIHSIMQQLAYVAFKPAPAKATEAKLVPVSPMFITGEKKNIASPPGISQIANLPNLIHYLKAAGITSFLIPDELEHKTIGAFFADLPKKRRNRFLYTPILYGENCWDTPYWKVLCLSKAF